ncbi:unnamed protein product [Darwinula stevensoni]|uniref:Uncharacterized protein n=1 Tax=Darwinula stevensoni TaxID=69355 RepID=A0A7R9ABB6_9CRUS|nr:unnamed protein product [Darwinula stevensoni]CAG0899003.1 unnamed protein product [Darwinula stevensoni]
MEKQGLNLMLAGWGGAASGLFNDHLQKGIVHPVPEDVSCPEVDDFLDLNTQFCAGKDRDDATVCQVGYPVYFQG